MIGSSRFNLIKLQNYGTHKTRTSTHLLVIKTRSHSSRISTHIKFLIPAGSMDRTSRLWDVEQEKVALCATTIIVNMTFSCSKSTLLGKYLFPNSQSETQICRKGEVSSVFKAYCWNIQARNLNFVATFVVHHQSIKHANRDVGTGKCMTVCGSWHR